MGTINMVFGSRRKMTYWGVGVVVTLVATYASMGPRFGVPSVHEKEYAHPVSSENQMKIIPVDMVYGDPSAFPGVITLEGISAGPQKWGSKSVFALVDNKSAEQMMQRDAEYFFLPVLYSDSAPRKGAKIDVTGRLVLEPSQGYLFVASKVVITAP